MAICEKHGWTQKKLPCPWICCPNGVRGAWVGIGKRKVTTYVRARDKDENGPRYYWEKVPPGVVLPG